MPSQFSQIKRTLPKLGVGMGFRANYFREIRATQPTGIDFFEFTPENYMQSGETELRKLAWIAENYRTTSHGVNLSIGSCDPLNKEYLTELKTLVDQFDVPWFSDHFCYSSAGGIYFQELFPLPRMAEAVSYIASRIRSVTEFIERPFLIENISYYMDMPRSTLSEPEFLAAVLEEADCGLLLDVNNLFVNSINHKFDPIEFLDKIPLDRVVQIHVAGHMRVGDKLLDTHGGPVSDPVLELLCEVLSRVDANAVMIERDQNFPCFNTMLAEISQLRSVCEKANQIRTDASGEAPASVVASLQAPIVLAIEEATIPPALQDFAEAENSILAQCLAGVREDALDLQQPENNFESNGTETYQQLLFWRQLDLLSTVFPMCSKLLSGTWNDLVTAYFKAHEQRSFRVWQNCEQFPNFLTTQPHFAAHDWLFELAQLELEKYKVSEFGAIECDGPYRRFQSSGELFSSAPVLNPSITLLSTRALNIEILHAITSGCIDLRKLQSISSACCFAIFLHATERRPMALSVSPRTRLLIESASTCSSYHDLLEQCLLADCDNDNCSPQHVNGETQCPAHPSEKNQIAALIKLIDFLQQQRIFIGSRPSPAVPMVQQCA